MLFPVILIVLSSFGWSLFDVTRKLLAERMPSHALLFWLMLGQMPFYGAWALLDGPPAIAADYLWPGLGCLSVNVLANFFFLVAVRISPLSLTIPMLAFSPVFATLV